MNQIPRRYYRFAETALNLARELENDMSFRFCAMIVSRNRVLSIGYNTLRTHPMMSSTYTQAIHAECDAIIRCPADSLRGSDMIVARAGGYNFCKPAKPCSFCQGIIARCGIRRVYHTVATNSREVAIKEMNIS